MRILVVTPWFPNQKHHFAGIFNFKDAQLLSKSHQIKILHLISPNLASSEEPNIERIDNGMVLERFIFAPNNPTHWVKAARKISHELKSADLLHSMAFPALFPTSLLHVRKPWVHTEHWSKIIGFNDKGLICTIKRTIAQKLLNRPDEVVTVSQALADVIATSANPNPTVIDNEVTMPNTHSLAKTWDNTKPLKLVSVGSAIDRKGPLIAVKTVHELKKQGIEAHLNWIGDGDLIATGNKLAADLNISNNIHFLGTVPPSEIHEKLTDSNIFVLPVISETFGVAIAEALGAGLPVVVTGTGGHHSFVNRENGRIVERNPEAVAEGIKEVLQPGTVASPEEISARAKARFNSKTRSTAYAEVYEKAIVKKQKG